jgi:hypothetical protein
VSPEALFKAVAKHLEAEAFRAEESSQTRKFTAQERIAFRAGFFRGLVADVHRADPAVWGRAAAEISKPANARVQPPKVGWDEVLGGRLKTEKD